VNDRPRESSGVGFGLSLWLIPEGEAHEKLSELIERFSRRFGTPAFEPHLTILGGIPSAEDRWLRRCADLARDTTPPHVRTDGAAFEDSYFRCLYLQAEATSALREIHNRARALLIGGEARPFLPHVSLLYGRLSREQKRDLVDELASLPQLSFVPRYLDVLTTEGPPAAWARAARFPFGAGPDGG
jgi:2'-5' RNA ligase